MLTVTDLAFAGRLHPLSFELQIGKILHIIGPNGSGKSTLLALLAGMLCGEGEITFAGCKLSAFHYQRLADLRVYLPQAQTNAFELRVYQYLALMVPQLAQRCKNAQEKQNVEQKVFSLCQQLSLSDKLNASVRTLSGGQWQRVRLAGALLQLYFAKSAGAKLLLLDEPMTSLDLAQEAAVYRLLREVAGQGVAIVMSNHDINQSIKHADHILLLKEGENIAFGEAATVMTTQTLAQVFGIAFVRYENDGRILLLPC
ncbi:MAG: vitamin B12 ABC transporter ATP-binding protein BtuD [Vibrionaceae bacterium]